MVKGWLTRQLQQRTHRFALEAGDRILSWAIGEAWSAAYQGALFTLRIDRGDSGYRALDRWLVERGASQLVLPDGFNLGEPNDVAELTVGSGRWWTWLGGPVLISRPINGMSSFQVSCPWFVRAALLTFLDDLIEHDVVEDMIGIHTPDGYRWYNSSVQRVRRPESVLLPAGQYEAILADIRAFQDSTAWYRERSVPSRRGYLLHGLPGTGKSSLVQALVAQCDLELHILSLADQMLSDAQLQRLFAGLPHDAALLLEDVDALWDGREADEAKISFSAVLNAIDGPAASQGRVMFLTTNRLERLDSALIRPGRVDYRLEFGTLTGEQAAGLCRWFYPEEPAIADTLLHHPKVTELVAAELQEILLRCREDPSRVIGALDEYTPTVARETADGPRLFPTKHALRERQLLAAIDSDRW